MQESVPEPVQFVECECSVVVFNVVLNIENQTPLTSPIQFPPQSPADHLKVKVWAVNGSRHDDGPGLRSVKAFPKYPVVD